MGTVSFLGTTNFITRHPVAIYYFLVFVISWGGLLLLIGPGGISGIMVETGRNALWLSVVLVTLAGPSTAGILSTFLVQGRGGLREFLSRLGRWRVGARWYAVAVLTAPLSVFATLLALSSFSPAYLPGIFVIHDKFSLLLFGLAAGVLAPFFEELGWTGFAIPQMSKGHSLLATGLFVGILWGAWHFLSNLWGVGPLSETVPLTVFMIPFLFSWLLPYRVLMVWVYDHTKSIFVNMVMHWSLVAFWLIATPIGNAGVNLVTWYIAWAAVLWGIAGVVVLKESRGKVPATITQLAVAKIEVESKQHR